MTPTEYADSFLADLYVEDSLRGRSQLAATGHVGVSDTFTCREKARLTLSGAQGVDRPGMAALVGTYVDEGVKLARKNGNPDLDVTAEYDITLQLQDGRTVTLVGHPDEIDPLNNEVTDIKTTASMSVVVRTGSDPQQRAQRMLYALGAVQAGVLTLDKPLTVRNVWVDRSGVRDSVHVEQELFDPQAIEVAAQWWDDVLYAVANKETASKDKPRPWCEACCPFFNTCRGDDTFSGSEVTEDPEIVAAAEVAFYARDIRLAAEKDEKEAKIGLGKFAGRAGPWLVVQTTVNARNGAYTKLEVRGVAK